LPDSDVDVAEAARRAGRRGYYVVDLALDLAMRGPFATHGPAVREAAEINRRRPHERPVEIRLV
jgi:hypothetical protein